MPQSDIPIPRNEEVEQIELARRLQTAEETLAKAKATFGEKVDKLKKRQVRDVLTCFTSSWPVIAVNLLIVL